MNDRVLAVHQWLMRREGRSFLSSHSVRCVVKKLNVCVSMQQALWPSLNGKYQGNFNTCIISFFVNTMNTEVRQVRHVCTRFWADVFLLNTCEISYKFFKYKVGQYNIPPTHPIPQHKVCSDPNQELLYLYMKLDTGGTRAVNSEAMATVHPKTLCDREAPTGKHLLLCQPRRSAGTICAINV